MSYVDILKPQLRIDEGVRYKPYRDSVGKLTIGVGHNLDDKPLRPEVIDLILDNDIEDAEADARKLFGHFDNLTDARKAVVVNMSFNLGYNRLSAFVKFCAAVNQGEWADAATEMENSSWYTQVGARGARLKKAMEEG